jgi:hypothetical protein
VKGFGFAQNTEVLLVFHIITKSPARGLTKAKVFNKPRKMQRKHNGVHLSNKKILISLRYYDVKFFASIGELLARAKDARAKMV